MCTPYLVRCLCRASCTDSTLSRHRDRWRFYVVQPAGYRLAIALLCGAGRCSCTAPPAGFAVVAGLLPVVLSGVAGLAPVVVVGAAGLVPRGARLARLDCATALPVGLAGVAVLLPVVLSGVAGLAPVVVVGVARLAPLVVAGVVALVSVVAAGMVGRCAAVVTSSGYLLEIFTNCPGVGEAALVSLLRFCPVALPW